MWNKHQGFQVLYSRRVFTLDASPHVHEFVDFHVDFTFLRTMPQVQNVKQMWKSNPSHARQSAWVSSPWILPQYSLSTLRKRRSPLRINGERGFLRVNILYKWISVFMFTFCMISIQWNLKWIRKYSPRRLQSKPLVIDPSSVSAITQDTSQNFQCWTIYFTTWTIFCRYLTRKITGWLT